jgi:hypothetical protein
VTLPCVGELGDRDPYFPISGSIIPDFFGKHLGIIDDDGGARRAAPPIKLDAFQHLPFHGVETWLSLCLGGSPVPPFQVPERLVDIPLGKLSDN